MCFIGFWHGCTFSFPLLKEPRSVTSYFIFYLIQNFKSNSLLSHESEVNKLQDDGDRLIELKHPASTTIQVHAKNQFKL